MNETYGACLVWLLGGISGVGCGDDGSNADAAGQTAQTDDGTDGGGEASTGPGMPQTSSTGAGSEGMTTTDGSTGQGTTAGSTTGTETEGDPGTDCDARDHAYDLTVTFVAASETDPGITDVFDHVYVEADGTPANKLFVFLPGTGGPPAGYQQILQNAAAGGYDALGLSYVNGLAVNELCMVTEPGCHEGVRNEVITGEDTSPLVDVAPVDSIEHRLVAALTHLGWDQYVVDGVPDWANIAFAGHSQGAGHAAFIAREHEVHRAVLFAGTEPADWTQAPLATPVDRLWGFVHVEDPIAAPVQLSWNNLGIPGPPADVDDQPPPFDGQQLQTASPDDGGNPHGSIVVDPSTPRENGLPVYREVWCTMIGP
jgi:hypothetical protein